MRYTFEYAKEMFPTWLALVRGRQATSSTDVGAYRLGSDISGLRIERIISSMGAIHVVVRGMTPKEFAFFVWNLESSLQERDHSAKEEEAIPQPS